MGKAERHFFQGLTGAGVALLFVDAFHHQPVGDIVEHRHMREQRVVLEHGVHVPLPGGQFAGFFAEDADRAAGQLLKAGDQPQAGGFAGAGRPQHGEELPVANGDGDPVHRPDVAVQPRNIDKFN